MIEVIVTKKKIRFFTLPFCHFVGGWGEREKEVRESLCVCRMDREFGLIVRNYLSVM